MAIGITGLTSGTADVYSNLLSSTSSTSGTDAFGATTLLSDYASIKNGSYGKMLKAYYQKQEDTDETASSTKKKEEQKDTATAASASTAYKSANSLNNADYSEDNIDELYSSVSSFLKDYNSMIKSATGSKIGNVSKQANWLNDMTYSNYKLLASVGITMNTDRTLSLNEENFKKANITTIKHLFSGTNSFADKIASRASRIYRYANGGAALTAKSYTSSGTYSKTNTEDSTIDSTT